VISSSRIAFIRRFVISLAILLVAAPLLVRWSSQCVDGMFNTPHLWIPAADEQRTKFEWFAEHFESPALVIISWPGCTVDDPRLAQLGDALTDPEHEHYDARSGALIDRVVTGNEVLEELMLKPLGLSRAAAAARLRGVLVGEDGQASCAVVIFTEQGGYDRNRAIEVILETAQAVCQLDRAAFHLAGPPVDGVAIDRAGIDTLRRYAVPSALVSFLFCWWCLRSSIYALVILAAAAVGEGLCLSFVLYSGAPMNAMLVLMPPFVFVLTMAAGVHLVSYYVDEVVASGVDGAARRGMQVGWFPCVLATTTTAIGMGSLLVSDIEPIRMFGGCATIGVVATLLLLFLLLPGAMELWPIVAGDRAERKLRANRRWLSLANFVIRHATVLFIATTVLIAALGMGLAFVQTSVKLRNLFSPHDRVLADYAWLEESLGPMVSVEVLIHFPTDSQVDFRTQVRFVAAVTGKALELDDVGGVMSAATLAFPIPPGGRVRGVAQKTFISRKLRKARYLYEDEAHRCWRVTARVPALSELDYAQFLHVLERQIAPFVAEYAARVDEPIRMTVTGALPLIYQTQRTLLADLIRSFLVAFVVVGIVMMLVLRSVSAGLLVMVPNVFPTAVVFGLMGWLRWPIDIGSMMTASIALGIAVVDTLHFLTWFRRDVAAGNEVEDAVRRAYLHCATPMLQTSIICGIGMLVFVFSSFTPASRFAWMVFVLLIAALVGDLVILPALLAGRLGRAFVSDRVVRPSSPDPV
jgi:predicted RND superfamily exporter protein